MKIVCCVVKVLNNGSNIPSSLKELLIYWSVNSFNIIIIIIIIIIIKL